MRLGYERQTQPLVESKAGERAGAADKGAHVGGMSDMMQGWPASHRSD